MSNVCLILEGTYPYVTGGVSSCVYQLIRSTPHLNYSIFYIAANQDALGEYKYPVPPNVRLIKKVFLFDYEIDGKLKHLNGTIDRREIFDFHRDLQTGKVDRFKTIYERYFDPDKRIVDPFDVLQSEEAWRILKEMYEKRFTPLDAPSFIDYFYTWRFTHYPLFKILTSELPKADVYHALCTGYAGLAGVVARQKFNRPFILTEHGIYSHERRIEILQSQWLLNTDQDLRAKRELPIFKAWWIRLFEYLGSLAYHEADAITTLFEGNRQKQIHLGADPSKVRILPNGVDYPYFSSFPRKAKGPEDKLCVALVGRVVPIKDIKTFIKAVAFLKKHFQNFEALIVGPTEEDEAYYEDCLQMVNILGLSDVITFTGKKDVAREIYPRIDLLVLSSISEGQPLVVLEAYCQGVPVVATDVGSCRELIFGMSAEDRTLGPSGDVVPFGKAELMGQSLLRLLRDNTLRAQMGEVAKERVRTYYQESLYVENYLSLYNEFFADRFWYGRNRI